MDAAKALSTAYLKHLVRRNYALREAGRLPDAWYWADRELMRRGEFVTSATPLSPAPPATDSQHTPRQP